MTQIPPDRSSSRPPPTVPYSAGQAAAGAPRVSEEVPPAPPPAPRPLTAAAKWRGFNEPRVRFWWLATLVLVVILIWYASQQIGSFSSERHLINYGTPVVATIEETGGDTRVGAKFAPGSPCTLKFNWQGKVTRVSGVLTPRTDQDYVINGNTVNLKVDPKDPASWTDRTDPEPIARRMIAGATILPVLLAALLAAWWLRRKTLRMWRDGEASLYVVIDSRHTALAPMSRAVRCASNNVGDRRLLTVYIPTKAADPQPGDLLWLIHPRNKPNTAVAAQAFV